MTIETVFPYGHQADSMGKCPGNPAAGTLLQQAQYEPSWMFGKDLSSQGKESHARTTSWNVQPGAAPYLLSPMMACRSQIKGDEYWAMVLESIGNPGIMHAGFGS